MPIPAPLAGALMMGLAAASFSIMHAMIRHLSAEVHPFEIAFFRVVFGFVALAPIFVRDGRAPLRTKNIKLFAYRGALNSAAMLRARASLVYMPRDWEKPSAHLGGMIGLPVSWAYCCRSDL